RFCARLGKFAGGWADEGAARACCWAPLRPGDALVMLTAPVGSSLVGKEETPFGSRYRMLESIRRYALEALEANGELAKQQLEHARYFLSRAEELEPLVLAGSTWIDLMDAEQGNFRAALETLTREGAVEGLRLAS